MIKAHSIALCGALLAFGGAGVQAQTAGTLNLQGPSTGGARQLTPADINSAVNSLLSAKADVANPALTGTALFGSNVTAGAAAVNGPAASQRIFQWSTAGSARWKLLANATAEGGSDAGSNLQLFSYSDAGASLGSQLLVTRSNGSWTWNNNNNFSAPTYSFHGVINANNDAIQGPAALAISSGVPISPGSTSKPALYWDTNWTGTWDTGGTAPYYFRFKDAVNGEPAAFIPSIWLIDNEYNTGAGNGRTFVTIVNNKNANSVISTADNTFVGLTVKGNLNSNEGDSSTYRTYWGALNLNVRCIAPYIRVCEQAEIDMGLESGSSARTMNGFAFNNNQQDSAHGAMDDNMIQFTTSSGVNLAVEGGRTTLLQLGTSISQWPLSPIVSNSALMQIKPYTYNNPVTHTTGQMAAPTQYYATYGFDLFYFNAASAVWRSPGWAVDGGGQQSLGPATLTYDASGNATLAITRVRETSAAIGTAGDHYKVTDEIADTNGGLWTVATLSGTGLATVTQLKPGYATSCPGSGNVVTAGSGQSGALNITCASLGNLILGATTHNVQLGGGSALATNATVGFPLIPTTAGFPTGSVGAAGKAALSADTTDKALCFNSGSGWSCGAGQGAYITATTTVTLLPGWTSLEMEMIGAGGGSGCGIVVTASTASSGGGSGGVGFVLPVNLTAGEVSNATSIVITPGTAGTSCAASGTTNGSTGSSPTGGGNTTAVINGVTFTSFGGGAGANGGSATASGGGGSAGVLGAGGNASAGTGGSAGARAGTNSLAGGSGAAGTNNTGIGFGPGGSGTASAGAGINAATAIWGAEPGGSGAGITAGNTAQTGGNGGGGPFASSGSGASGGAATCTGTSQNGANGVSTSNSIFGNGGAGGASCTASAGGNGGNASGNGSSGGGGGSAQPGSAAGSGGTSSGGAVRIRVH